MKNDSKDTEKQPEHGSCMPLETSVFEEPTPLGGENENDVLPQETVLMVDQTDADTRIDVFLAQNTALTRASVHKRIAAGDVKCNGEIIQDKNFRLHPTDCVQLIIPPPQPLHAQAQNIPLQIVYEDDDLLVVNKPRGMVVHPAAGNEDGTLVNALLYHCAGRLSSINGVIRPGIVHRIDKDTSGLLLVAKNDMAPILSAALRQAEHIRSVCTWHQLANRLSETAYMVKRVIRFNDVGSRSCTDNGCMHAVSVLSIRAAKPGCNLRCLCRLSLRRHCTHWGARRYLPIGPCGNNLYPRLI